MEIFSMILKLAIFLPMVLFLIYLSLKYGGNKLQSIQNGKFIKIIEKMPISKENSLLIVEMGNKAYVLSSTPGKIEILMELTEEEISMVKENKNSIEYKDVNEFFIRIQNKLKNKKEE